MAHPLRTALDTLTERFTAAGIRATIDPRDANPPCALITVEKIGSVIGGCNTVDALAYLIAPDTGMGTALDTLGDMLDRAATVPGVADATPETITLPTSGSPLPALRLSIPTTL